MAGTSFQKNETMPGRIKTTTLKTKIMNIRRLFFMAIAVCLSTACNSSHKVAADEAESHFDGAELSYDDTKMIRKTLPLRDFKEIECSGIVRLRYRQSPNYSVAVRTTAQIHKKADISVVGGRLRVRFNGNLRMENGQYILVDISAPAQRSITISGMVNAELSDISTNDFTLTAGGMSTVSVGNIKGSDITLDKGGSAKLSALRLLCT